MNLVIHTKTKYIAIRYHYLRELVQDKELKMEYVSTRALPKDAREYLRGKLGVIPLSKAI